MKKEEIKNPYKLQDLTEREKAIIIYAIVTDCRDWRKIYMLSREKKPAADYSEKNIAAAASKWKLSAKVAKFVMEQKAIFEAKAAALKAQAVEEAKKAGTLNNETGGKEMDDESENFPEYDGRETKEGKGRKKNANDIDFTNREQLLAFLNQQANTIADAKQKTDYIKMIADLVRMKDADNAASLDIQRFYTPVTCHLCPLYVAAEGKDM